MFKLCWGKSPVILQKHEWPFWGLCWIPWLFTSPFHFNWSECENLPLVKSLVVVSLQVPGGCSQLESWSLGLRVYSLTVSLRLRGTPRRFPGLSMGGAPPLVLCPQVPVASLFLNSDLWILVQWGCNILGVLLPCARIRKFLQAETWGYHRITSLSQIIVLWYL